MASHKNCVKKDYDCDVVVVGVNDDDDDDDDEDIKYVNGIRDNTIIIFQSLS